MTHNKANSLGQIYATSICAMRSDAVPFPYTLTLNFCEVIFKMFSADFSGNMCVCASIIIGASLSKKQFPPYFFYRPSPPVLQGVLTR